MRLAVLTVIYGRDGRRRRHGHGQNDSRPGVRLFGHTARRSRSVPPVVCSAGSSTEGSLSEVRRPGVCATPSSCGSGSVCQYRATGSGRRRVQEVVGEVFLDDCSPYC